MLTERQAEGLPGEALDRKGIVKGHSALEQSIDNLFVKAYSPLSLVWAWGLLQNAKKEKSYIDGQSVVQHY